MAPARTTDIDGDGRADVCGRGGAGVWCHLSNGTSWAVRGPVLGLSDDSGWGDSSNWGTFRFGDIDGDGRADLCARADKGMSCWKSDGVSLSKKVTGPDLSDAKGFSKVEYFSTIRLLDMDGDGMDDVCVRAAKGIVCYKSTGDGFGAVLNGPPWSDTAGLKEPKYYGTLQTGDVNGDGRMDVCMRIKEGMECWLSDGNGFPTKVKGPEWSDAMGWGARQYWSTIRLVDVNGDGKADLCARNKSSLRCHFSTGKGFEKAVEVAALSDEQGWNKEGNYLTLRTGDIDGDGRRTFAFAPTRKCYAICGMAPSLHGWKAPPGPMTKVGITRSITIPSRWGISMAMAKPIFVVVTRTDGAATPPRAKVLATRCCSMNSKTKAGGNSPSITQPFFWAAPCAFRPTRSATARMTIAMG